MTWFNPSEHPCQNLFWIVPVLRELKVLLLLHSTLYLKVEQETERTRWWMKFWRFGNPSEIQTPMETRFYLWHPRQKPDFIMKISSKHFTKLTILVPFNVWFGGIALLKKAVSSTWIFKCRGLQGSSSSPTNLMIHQAGPFRDGKDWDVRFVHF